MKARTPPQAPTVTIPGGPREEVYAQLAESSLAPRRIDLVLRMLDVALASAALVVLAPEMGAVAIGVRATSGAPVLYRGARVGRFGRVFTMYKFRTLKPDAETRLGPYLGAELSRRTEGELTGVGRVLRASHFDELPQLFNVVRGDMSIVGPRPIRPAFYAELCEEIPQYWQRLVVRPGMTGLAQLRVTREMTWAEKLAHDLEYLADRSLGMYLRVIGATAVRVVVRSTRGVASALREGR
jgi:lipopolysaccharide/colanic/teichoic acid biosynthesis glycosyltransferase